MTKTKPIALKYVAILIAALLVLSIFLPFVNAKAGMPTNRYIKLSSSRPSQTGVSYEISFKPATAHTLKSLVIEFCSDSPIIGITCTAPTGMNINAPGTITPTSGLTTTWSTANSTANRLNLNKAAGNAVTTASTITFTLNNVTNPNSVSALYGRIITYSNDTGANSQSTYTATSPGSYVDAGGTANAIVNNYRVSATIQESLSLTVPGTDVIIGHSAGAATVIDSSAVDTATVTFTNFSTNAVSGAVINLRGDTLYNGSNFLANQATLTAMTAGSSTNQFGIRTANGSATIGAVTAVAKYASATNYAFDSTATKATYGDPIFNSAGAPVIGGTGTITYGATAAPNTPAGIYSTDYSPTLGNNFGHQLIATGTF